MRATPDDPAGEAPTGGHFGGASSLWPAQLPREPAAAWGLLRSRGNRAQASRRQGKPHKVEGGVAVANDGSAGGSDALAWSPS